MGEDSGGNTSLSVQGSTIIGTAFSAILVQSFESGVTANANILIGAGSLVQGGNGVAIEVTDSAAATITVDNSTLQGAIVVDDTGTASATLSNGAKVNGDVTNVSDVTLNSASTLTGNLTRTTNLLVSGNSVIIGNVSEVQSFTLDGASRLDGNVSNVQTSTSPEILPSMATSPMFPISVWITPSGLLVVARASRISPSTQAR